MKRILTIGIVVAAITIICLVNYNETEVAETTSDVAETSSAAVGEFESSILNDLTNYDASVQSIDNPYVELDLYGMNPLSGYIAFPVEKASSFSYTVVGKDEYSSFDYEDDTLQSNNIVIPIIGLYANYENQVNLTVTDEDGTVTETTITMTTGDVASYTNDTIEVSTTESKKEAYESLEGGFIIDNRINGYDVNGEIRIAMEIEDLDWQGNGLRVNDDGSFMMGTQDYLYNISITGKVLDEYKAPDGYYQNHDYISASNGYTYIILSPDEDNMTYSDSGFKNEGFIGVYETGVDELPTEIYDINTLVSENLVNAVNTFSTNQDELLHLNALTYDEATDTLMMSSQSQNAIIAIDPNTGDMKWIIADDQLVNTNSDKVLTQLGDFVQTSGQHSINVTDNPLYDDGDDSTIEITVYNNEFCYDSNGEAMYASYAGEEYYGTCQAQESSSLLVYRINTKDMSVETIDNNEVTGYYSSIRSSWFQSPDYEYNYVTYGDLGQFVVTDSDYNPLLVVQSDEADVYYQNMYRVRVFMQTQLQDIEKLENL